MANEPAHENIVLSPEEEGHLFEEAFFNFIPAFDRSKLRQSNTQIISFKNSLTEVMQCQHSFPWDTKEPKTELATTLFNAVKSNLSKGTAKKLLLYCALGTTLDFVFRVDGFFILGNNYLSPVTFDLARTDNAAKRRKLMANGLITISDMKDPNRVQEIALAIAKRLHKALCKRIPSPYFGPLW